MKLKLLLKVLRFVAKRYTKFNLFSYCPLDGTKYYGKFEYLEYCFGDTFPTKTDSRYSGYRTRDDIKKEYNHHMIRSMYSLIGWIRCKRFEHKLEIERKNITKLLK